MSRRRARSGLSFDSAQDPGKDLFAYLFLMITVFSFMILTVMEENRSGVQRRHAPEQHFAGENKGLVRVFPEKIGTLVRKDGRLYLAFGNTFYHPVKDAGRLEVEGRVSVIQTGAGEQKKILYVNEDAKGRVLLEEYLDAFHGLSRLGISVVFAKEVG